MNHEIQKILFLTPLNFELGSIYQQFLQLDGAGVVGEMILNYKNKQIYFFTSGQGKVNAAIAMTRYFYEIKPDLVVVFGSCGALTENFRRGDIVQVSEVEEFDYTSSYKGAKNPKFKLINNNENRIFNFPLIKIASGDRDIVSLEERKKLHLLTKADIVTWESAGFIKAAKKIGQSYLELRVITDSLNNSYFDKNSAKQILDSGAKQVLEFLKLNLN